MLKKALTVFAAIALILFLFTATYAESSIVESSDVKVIIDGQLYTYAYVPVNINGRLFLPIREVAVSLGVANDNEHIIWNDAEKSATIIYGDIKVNLVINNPTVTVNGETRTFDTAPVIYKDKTYVPLRMLSECFNRKVHWDEKLRAAFITTEEQYNKVRYIAEKSSEALSAIKKGTIDTKMEIQIFGQGSSVSFTPSMSTRFDRESKRLHIVMDVPIMGNLSFNRYYGDNALYNWNMFKRNWEKTVFEDEYADIFFQNNVDVLSLANSETICSGMVVEEDAGSNKYIVKGNIYQADVFNLVNEVVYVLITFELDEYYTTVYVDMDSFLIEKIVMDIGGGLDSQLGENYSAKITCQFNNINGNFEITLPDGV